MLNVFRQVHDLSSLTGFPDELTKNAWLFHFHGIHYANGRQAKAVIGPGPYRVEPSACWRRYDGAVVSRANER